MDALPQMTNSDANKIIASSPVVSTPLPETQSVTSTSPLAVPRQIWAAGLFAIIAWLILWAISRFAHLDIDLWLTGLGFAAGTAQATLAGIIGLAVAKFVPPSIGDRIKWLNDQIVHLAQRDPKSDVSYVLPPVRPPVGETPIVDPAATASP